MFYDEIEEIEEIMDEEHFVDLRVCPKCSRIFATNVDEPKKMHVCRKD